MIIRLDSIAMKQGPRQKNISSKKKEPNTFLNINKKHLHIQSISSLLVLIVYSLLHFSRAVLQVQDSNGINDIGTPILKLTICVFIVYCMLYFSLFKGVKSSGKFFKVFMDKLDRNTHFLD